MAPPYGWDGEGHAWDGFSRERRRYCYKHWSGKDLLDVSWLVLMQSLQIYL